MIVGDFKLSYPFIKYSADVIHFTARKSTAIEWVILELVSRFSDNKDYGPIPVDRIFKDILQISDSDLLIKPCLIDLQDLGALNVIDLSDDVSLSEIPLRNIKLTRDGIEMQAQGLLPGEDNDNKIDIYYDVTADALVEGVSNNLKEHANGMPLMGIEDEEEIEFPVSLINQKLLEDQNKRKYQWLQKTTKIKEIEKIGGELLWRNISKKIKINGNGQFVIEGLEGDDPANSLLFNKDFVEASDYDSLIEVIERPQNIDDEYSRMFFTEELSERISEVIKKDSICFINFQFWNDRYAKELERKGTSLIVQFCADSFDFNYNDKKVTLNIPYSMPYPGCIILTNRDNIFASRFNLYNESGSGDFNLGYSKKNLSYAIKDSLKVIINKFSSENYQVVALYTLIEEEDAVFNAIPNLLQKFDSLEDKIEALDNLSKLCNKISGKQINLDNQISNVLIEGILKENKFSSVNEVIDAVNKVSSYKVSTANEKVMQQCILSILENVQGIKKHSDILMIWDQLFENKRISSSWIAKNGPFNNLYSRQVQESLFSQLLNGDYMKASREYTETEKIFTRMRQILKNLGSELLEMDWRQLYSKEKVYELILSNAAQLDTIRNQVLSWNDWKLKLKSFDTDFAELASEIELLGVIESNMSLIIDGISVFFDDDLVKYDKVYIFDTCSLMNRSDIFELFLKNELVVIPNTVLEELDRHKSSKDERKAYEAREAIRQINSFKNIRFEEAYPELLPVDFRDNVADNLILSTALKFITKRPMIIADDINLRNKAKSQKIGTTGIEGFIRMKEQEQKAKDNNLSNEKHKKKKKKK